MLMTNIGYSYYLAGDMERASAWFGRALLVDAEFAPAVKNLALLYARQGWYDQAVKTFSKVTGQAQAYNDVGYVAMRQGDYEQAHELLTEAIRLSPVYYQKAYDNLATLKKQMDAAGTATPAEAALRSNASHIVVAEGQAPRKATVTAEILNVRSSPEADSDIVTHLKAGDPVEVIMTMPNWAFVNYRPAAQDANLTGWVNSRYVGSQEAKSTLMAVPEILAATEVPAPETPVSPTVAAAASDAIPVQQIQDLAAPESLPVSAPLPAELPVEIEAASVATIAVAEVFPPDTTVAVTVAAAATETVPVQQITDLPAPASLPVSATLPTELPVETEASSAAILAAVEAAPAVTAAVPDNQSALRNADITLVDDVTHEIDAVCEPGSPTEKTPQGAASCIGVASLSADE
jgi:uncharacterized protein YgiM (DUF1202 family)